MAVFVAAIYLIPTLHVVIATSYAIHRVVERRFMTTHQRANADAVTRVGVRA